MTTPDKEAMPTAGRLTVSPNDGANILNERGDVVVMCFNPDDDGGEDYSENLAAQIVTACNAYEPMREALILAEKADRIHSKCQECEDGAQAPEACGDCFPSADDARVARRNVLKSLGVRMRDVDRARAIKAEPSICNCSQEDVHDYGPCGEDCRSLVVSTLPVNDRQTSSDVGRLREELAQAETYGDDMRKRWRKAENALHQFNYPPDPKMLREVADEIDCGQTCEFGNIEWDTGAHNCSKREREGCPGDNAIQLREFADAIEARAALKGVPQPASDDYQADAGAPALSEKVNVRSEWLPIESAPKDGTKFIGLWRGLPYAVHWQLYYEQWPHQEGGPTYRGGWSAETWDRHMPCSPTHWILLPELNFSNEAERDGVSLKSDTSSQPASEAGKLSQ